MKSLIIGDINDVYLREFSSEIMSKRNDVEFDVLSLVPSSSDYNFAYNVIYPKPKVATPFLDNRISRILFGIEKYKACKHYDEIIVLYVDRLTFAVNMFKSRRAKIVLCFYGSDLLRASHAYVRVLKRVVRCASTIIVENEFMKRSFESSYGTKNGRKVRFAHYGTNNAAVMRDFFMEDSGRSYKKEFGLSEDKIQILIGYNGSKAQNHLKVIEALKNLSIDIKSKVALVVHCSYGLEDGYLHEISYALEQCKIESKIMTDYLQGKRLAEFRTSIDILIHWQTTDCMAASMVEAMDAGTVVVNGSWLQYPDLKKAEGYYETAENEYELTKLLSNIVLHFDEYKEKTKYNRGILNILSWNFSEWNDALSR